jgi:hypothetical protein
VFANSVVDVEGERGPVAASPLLCGECGRHGG